jgi:hypothetical protein
LRGKAFVTSLEAKTKIDLVSAKITELSNDIAQSAGTAFDSSQAGEAQGYLALLAAPFAIPVFSQIYVVATAITNVLQSVEVLSFTEGSSRGRWSYSWAGNEDITMQERLDSTLCVFSSKRYRFFALKTMSKLVL